MKRSCNNPLTLLPATAILATGFFLLLTAQKPDNKKHNKHDTLATSGKASFYANMLQGSNTSSGDVYDKNDFTCAHRTFPFNTILCVTNVNNGKKAIVRVNDRGPYRKGRIIDLSTAAAKKLGMLPNGVVKVRIQELSLLDVFPLDDSLLHDGEVIDAHGNLKKPGDHLINVWETPDLKHAMYMATNIENDYRVNSVYIKASGKGDNRNYMLYISNIVKKEEADKLISSLKQDGFSLCRHEKK